MAQVPGYDYDPERDRRWRSIVDNFCVLTTKNEADAIRLRPHPYEFALYYDI